MTYAAPTEDAQLVTMFAGGAYFGVPVTRVRDVLAATQIYAAPLAPRSILGSINLRGRIVTAIDLRTRLGMEAPADQGACKCVIVERTGGEPYALLVDEIGDVMMLSAALYEPNPITLNKHWAHICRGLYRQDGQMLVVLDIDALLEIEAEAA